MIEPVVRTVHISFPRLSTMIAYSNGRTLDGYNLQLPHSWNLRAVHIPSSAYYSPWTRSYQSPSRRRAINNGISAFPDRRTVGHHYNYRSNPLHFISIRAGCRIGSENEQIALMILRWSMRCKGSKVYMGETASKTSRWMMIR